jgi:hypothetical protein
MAGVVVRAGLGHHDVTVLYSALTTSAHALQLQGEYVDLKPHEMTLKKIMMAKHIADNFEQFGQTITHQWMRGALPKIVQGGGLRLVHVSPI